MRGRRGLVMEFRCVVGWSGLYERRPLPDVTPTLPKSTLRLVSCGHLQDTTTKAAYYSCMISLALLHQQHSS